MICRDSIVSHLTTKREETSVDAVTSIDTEQDSRRRREEAEIERQAEEYYKNQMDEY